MNARRLRNCLVVASMLVGACSCDDTSPGGADAETDAALSDAQTDAGDGGADAEADADPCADATPPVVTGSIAAVGFPIGSGTAAYMLTFDQPVTIDAGAIAVNGGALLDVTPSLPATAASFMVTLTGLVDGTDYQLTLADDAAVSACGDALDGAIAIDIVSACVGDTRAPTITSPLDPLTIDFDETAGTYTLAFDEMVALDAGAITLDGGATVRVEPELPAVATTFTVILDDLTDLQSYDLTIVSAAIADRCGNALGADATIEVVGACTGDATAPTITSGLDPIVIPPGATTISYPLTFDEPVALDVDAVTATNGAVVTVEPALPAIADEFTVTLSSLSSAQSYALAIDAAHATDRCDIGLATGATIDVTGACVGNVAPTITSAAGTVRFHGGTYTHTLTFDEPVWLDAGAISVDNDAELSVTPALPSFASSFEIVLSALDDGEAYALTIDASAADVCGATPAAGQTLDFIGCGGDTNPPILTSATTVTTCTVPGPAYTYTLTLDEVTYVPVGGITAEGGTITSITPALPAYASTFEVVVDLATATTLTLHAGAIGACGGATTSDSTVALAPLQSATFAYTGAIVPFTVPESACGVTIEVWGAQGGYNTSSVTQPGLGARMRGTFATLPSRDLRILVGEQPSNGSGNGGGGGSFVVTSTNVPLVIAGGGGGSSQASDGEYKHGSVGTSGQSCPASGGVGGQNGNGGGVGASGFQSGAGGGLLTNGADGWTSSTGGTSFVGGGAGGTTNAPARGGFGGGGSGSSYVVGGGGGGYSGGGGCGNANPSAQVGAGGGSYNAAPVQDNEGGVRQGHGQVVIYW